MKKVLIASGVAVMAFAMIAGAQATVFSMNLTVGSTGADVVALQTALINGGYSIPAITSGAAAKGYFGSQTKAAVMAYQAARSIPNTGFVGPLTRAALNGGVAGAPVAVGCPAGYTCTLIGGGTPVVGSPTGITTPGAEGVLTTKLASSPIADANIVISSNVPVYGIEVKAQGSDMVVDRVLLQVAVGVGGAATSLSNPATFVRSLSAYDGSTLLKTWNLGPADFNKDSSDRYYVIASGMRFVVLKDTTRVLTFKMDVSGVSADMSARYVTVQGYAGNTQNVRAIDGLGLSSYADMSGSANSRVQVFNTSGNSSLTVTTNSALTPKSTNIKIDATDGSKEVVMQVFDIKSTTGASVVKKIYVTTNATATVGLPSTLYLYDGSTLLSSVSAPTTLYASTAFTDLTVPIAKDQTKTFTIKADFPTTGNGNAASTSIATNGVSYEKPDSTTASSTITQFGGNSLYRWTAAPQWTLVSSSITPSAGVLNVSSSSLTATMVLKATAVGGAMTKPVVGDITMIFASSTAAGGAYSTTGNINAIAVTPIITVTPTDATVGENGTYTVTVTGTLYSNNAQVTASAPFLMAVSALDSVVGAVTITNQTWGIDDFYTAPAQLTKAN